MIILFGAAGSGKSIQGQGLVERHGWRWMSVGQLLRDRNDPEMNEIMLKGELVPDEYVVEMMHSEMMKAHEAGEQVVLDGYPRTQWQANWIVENGDDQYIDGAIIIDVDREELWRRLEERGREDDTRESIEKRWDIFEHTIYTMTETLQSKNVRVAHVDGNGPIEEIGVRIDDVLNGWGIINTQSKQE